VPAGFDLSEQPAWSSDGGLARFPRSAADLNALLDDPRTPSLIRRLSSVTLHRVTATLGRADCAELIALATPEQVRELLDLELWRDGELDIGEALDWISFLMRELPETASRRALGAIDVELIGLLILSRAQIYLTDELDPDHVFEAPTQTTPDGWFVIELHCETEEQAQQLVSLIDATYQLDPEDARRLLQALTWEQQSSLEEACRRWRDGRLQDLGFADPTEALALYAYLPPGSVRVDEGSADRPLTADPEPPGQGGLILPPPESSFLDRALKEIEAEAEAEAERQRLAQALAALGNRAIVADHVSPSDLAGIERSLAGLHDRLGLGLEHLAASDLVQARAILGHVALLRIARVGHSLVLDLRRPLQSALRSGRFGSAPGRSDRLDPPLAEQIAALSAPRPAYFDAGSGERRSFRDLRDLAVAREWVADALAAVEIATGLELDRAGAPAGLSFGDLYRTATVCRLLGEPRLTPIDDERLRRFLRAQTGPALARAASDLPASLQGRARGWVERWLRELEEALGALDPKSVDLRFVGGLWLAS
jgi:hypothetical protein